MGETLNGNFGVGNLLGKINPFDLNVIDLPPRPDGFSPRGTGRQDSVVKEHFRSTGIRDGPPNEEAYDRAKRICSPNADIWDKNNIECFAGVWDHEVPISESPTGFQSNDVNEDARPSGCGPDDSGKDSCPSALYDSIDNLRRAFGTPRNSEYAVISNSDFRAVWLNSEYPPGFQPLSRQ